MPPPILPPPQMRRQSPSPFPRATDPAVKYAASFPHFLISPFPSLLQAAEAVGKIVRSRVLRELLSVGEMALRFGMAGVADQDLLELEDRLRIALLVIGRHAFGEL